MKVIPASHEILTPISEGGIEELKFIEKIGRVCYKSESKISPEGNSAKTFVRRLIHNQHESVLEHSILTVRFVVDRGISHEIVRHRNCSFSMESTRYCLYDDEITVIRPWFFEDEDYLKNDAGHEWFTACTAAEFKYKELLKHGWKPEMARDVLPTSLKTELIMTANYREWRHFLKLRTGKGAHPQMKEVTIPLLVELHEKLPIIFDDITFERGM